MTKFAFSPVTQVFLVENRWIDDEDSMAKGLEDAGQPSVD